MAELIRQPYIPPLTSLNNYWYWGPPSTGKSWFVRKTYPDAYIACSPLESCWDEYDDQDVVIIENFDRPSRDETSRLWILADHYPVQVITRDGCRFIRPKMIIVTSTYSPRDVWTARELDALTRRFNIVRVGGT